jgi:tetratricopeptide (TPR) repeat protein
MTDITNRVLPEPKNWQDFERLCFDLYRRMWKTSDADMNGRQGQPQAGVDIFGTDRVEGKFVGVQCKGKDRGYGNKLTEPELKAEIQKAKRFIPSLDVFVIATTAPNDVHIQQIARTISCEHAKQELFEVRVQGWGTLQNYITDDPQLLSKHFRDLAPFDLIERMDAGISVTERVATQVARIGSQLSALSERLDSGDPLEAKIIQAAKLTDDGMAQAALTSLDRILQEDGSRLTPRHLFRLRAGIGFAHVALGDMATAAKDFRDADSAEPEWPGAQAILAIAELLEGRRDSAFDRAKHVLSIDQTSYHAAAVIMDTAPAELGVAELEALIPASLQDRVDIPIGLSLRARKVGDFTAAEAYSRRALTLKPNDLRALSSVAEVLLEPIFSEEGIGFTRIIPTHSQARFNEGLELLLRAWEQLAKRDDVARYDHIVANLITALDIAGRESQAERILDHALQKAPRSPPLLRRHTRKMALAGEWQDVLKTVGSIPSPDVEPPDELIRLQALLRTGDAQHALTEARALQEKFGDSWPGEAASALRLEAAAALGSLSDELDAALSTSPGSIVLRSVAIGLLRETDPRRDALVAEIDRLVEQIKNIQDRFHAAEALFAAEQYSKAADLYVGLHGTDKDDIALYRHLTALHLADRRLEARQLFDSLDEPIKALPQYAEAGAAIYERAGLLAECRDILERTLLQEENLHRRLQWLNLCERINDQDKVIEWLEGVGLDQQGSPRDLMFLALAIDRYFGDTRSLPIAYRALKAGYDDPQVHLNYNIGLFLIGRVGRTQIDHPEQVGPDTAVVLLGKNGHRPITRIIESEPNPRIDRDEIAVDDPFAGKLIGLRIGDEIELQSVAPENPHYIVSSIQNKYIHAHFRSLERFETMFPENRAFGSLIIDPAKGDQQFKPIFDAVKNKGEFAKQIKDLYRSGHLPLAMAAKFGGAAGFEFWDAVLGDPDLQFNVVLGRAEDYAEAHKTLSEGSGRAVIDPITIYGLVRLRIADTVRESFDDLGVVHTTIDLLRGVLHERQSERGRHQGTLAWDGERYQMIELGPEVIEGRISRIREVLEFAETLTLVPAEALGEIKEEAKKLFEDLHPAYLDTVLSAKGDNRILLSDDLPFRVLAAEAARIQTIWSQASVRYAANRGRMPPDHHFHVGNTLAEAKYFFTLLNFGNFIHALKQSNWVLTPTVRALVDLLARPANEPQGVLNVLSELGKFGWPLKPNVEVYEGLFTAIFTTFKTAQPDRDLKLIRNTIFAAVQEFLRRRYILYFRDGLLQSTFLKPVEAIAAEGGQIQRGLVSHIGRTLGRALQKASG